MDAFFLAWNKQAARMADFVKSKRTNTKGNKINLIAVIINFNLQLFNKQQKGATNNGCSKKRLADEAPVRDKFIFNLGLADVLRLTMFGTLISLARDITRLPLHLPGHTSIYWMGIMVLGKGLIPRFGAGIVMGLVSGILAMLLGEGKEGVFVFFRYFAPGILLDLLAPLFSYKLENPFVGPSAVPLPVWPKWRRTSP